MAESTPTIGRDIETVWDVLNDAVVWVPSEHDNTDACRVRDAQEALARIGGLASEVAGLRAALVEHNDCLRSAFQIVQREAIHDTAGTTSWNLAADRFSQVLHNHHETIVAAREAINGKR